MVRKTFLFGIAAVLLSLSPVLRAQDLSNAEMEAAKESLLRHFSPEDRAEIERQHEIYFQENPVTELERHGKSAVNEIQGLKKTSSVMQSNALHSNISRILLMVDNDLYSDDTAESKIDRYAEDISNAYSCTVEMEILSGGTPTQLKEVINGYYTDGGLDGVVKIGQFTPAMFLDPDPDYGGYFSCDLFYMDLDGTWIDENEDGQFETHLPGSGDRAPEVFLGRIDPSSMGSFGTEVNLLASYLDKNHDYWMGNIPLKKSAYVHIENDWQNSTNEVHNIYGEENTGIIRGTATRDDWANNTLKTDYSFVHLWCHAGWSAHYFHNGGSLTYNDIWDIKPEPIAYAHDGCHVADWVAGRNRGYVVGSYVFSESRRSLVAISGTKTGQWLGLTAGRLFELLGENYSIGEAYKEWFGPYINNVSESRYSQLLAWDYGYCIIGDPMISMISVPSTVAYSLATNTTGKGTVSRSSDGPSYGSGTQVTLTAIPDSGWVFSSWEGDETGSSNPADVVVDTNQEVTAVFTEMPEALGQKLTIDAHESGSEYSSETSAAASYDQDTTTRWLNNGVIEDSWIEYDLSSAATVKTVRLMLNIGLFRTVPLKIEVGDGDGYSEVWSGTTSLTNAFQNINLPDETVGRYVRISMTGENSEESNWLSIVETEILGDMYTGVIASSNDVMKSLSRTIRLGGERLNIQKKSGVEEIALYNTAGRVVFRQQISPGTHTLDLSSYRLGSGSYILRVKIKGKYRTKRTVITK